MSIDGQLFVKKETTAGTAIAVVAADIIECNQGDAIMSLAGVTAPHQRRINRAHVDVVPPAALDVRYWALGFTTELKCTTAIDAKPEIDTLLEAAGMRSTVDAGVKCTYKWDNNPNQAPIAATVVFQEMYGLLDESNEYKAHGANLGFELSQSADGPLQVNWSGMGGYNRPTTLEDGGGAEIIDVLTSTGVYGGGNAPPLVTMAASSPFQFDGQSGLVVRSWTVRSGMSCTPRRDHASSDGYLWPCHLTRTTPVEWEIELESQESTTAFQKYEEATELGSFFFTLQATHSSGTRSCTITLNKARMAAPVRVPGSPNMVRLSGTAHTDGEGSSASSSLEIKFF